MILDLSDIYSIKLEGEIKISVIETIEINKEDCILINNFSQFYVIKKEGISFKELVSNKIRNFK